MLYFTNLRIPAEGRVVIRKINNPGFLQQQKDWYLTTIMKIILPLIFSILINTGFGQPKLPGQTKKGIDSIFQRWNNLSSPGFAIGVLKDTTVLYTKGYGAANLDHKISITPQSSFDIASVSKQFTAACIALLISDEKLTLETPASIFIPALAKYKDTIRIKHLIYNCSGITDYYKLPRPGNVSWITFNYFTIDDCIKVSLVSDTLAFIPGTKWDYCNVNFMLLTKVVEKISGQSFRSFINDRLFRPIGMNNTLINDDVTEIIPRRVTPYNPRIKEYIAAYQSYGITISDSGAWLQHPRNAPHYGGSGVVTSIDDLLRWSSNFFTKRFGGQAFYDLMHATPMFPHGRNNQAFGLYNGQYKGKNYFAWDGADFGTSSQLIRFPDQKIAIAVLSNVGNGEAYRKALLIAEQLIAAGLL